MLESFHSEGRPPFQVTVECPRAAELLNSMDALKGAGREKAEVQILLGPFPNKSHFLQLFLCQRATLFIPFIVSHKSLSLQEESVDSRANP